MLQELKQVLTRKGKQYLPCVLKHFLFKEHTTVHMENGMTAVWMMYGGEMPYTLNLLVVI